MENYVLLKAIAPYRGVSLAAMNTYRGASSQTDAFYLLHLLAPKMAVAGDDDCVGAGGREACECLLIYLARTDVVKVADADALATPTAT